MERQKVGNDEEGKHDNEETQQTAESNTYKKKTASSIPTQSTITRNHQHQHRPEH
jgi:hypothetical protein